jgi:hypothetical protein
VADLWRGLACGEASGMQQQQRVTKRAQRRWTRAAGPVVKQATLTHNSSAWRDAQRSEWCTHQQQHHKVHIEGGVQAVGHAARRAACTTRGAHRRRVRVKQGKMVSLSVNFNLLN